MESKAKLSFYKSMLPYGYKMKVAAKAGLKVQTVSDFLNGRNKSKRVEDAILIIIAEIQAERKQLLKKAGLLQ